MDFSESLKAFATPRFDDAFKADVSRNQIALPLERSCPNGGWPGDVSSIVVSNSQVSEFGIVVAATVHFAETLPSACRSATYQQACNLRIEIDRNDASAKVEYLGDFYSAG